jgi:hypothetical protein
MIYTIPISTLLIAAYFLYSSLQSSGESYGTLTLADIGKNLGEALVPGIFTGMAVYFVLMTFFPVKEIGHPFAPSFGSDLIYKARIKSMNGKEVIGEAYVYYDPSPAEDDCPIEVGKLKFSGRTYEVDSDEGYCLYGLDRWGEIGLEGRTGVEVMLLDEKVGEW